MNFLAKPMLVFAGFLMGYSLCILLSSKSPETPAPKTSIEIVPVGTHLYLVGVRGDSGLSFTHYAGCTNLHCQKL